MKNILVIIHQPTTETGRVGQILTSYGYKLDIRLPSQGDALPHHLEKHEAVIVFGGPMSANDENTLPYIRTELNWISLVLESKKPYLGICLGAQLLAKVLGAKVSFHPEEIREIGYFPITPTVEGQGYFNALQYVYQWHQEGFELPSGAVLLATGKDFPNQAFRYGKTAYGLQFHPEMTEELMKRWIERGREQLTLPGSQSLTEQLHKHHLYGTQGEKWLKTFLPSWINSIHPEQNLLLERRSA
ncbi:MULTISPECIES: glutamine amidotransferase-related protein [Planktothrix]|uniref:Glutamine amidotransferase n=1 Tax=Planktothrix mougeotii LEGE 06226 TaxID=1828728 RepID=A0ABR9UE82_9CYAN|nr:MULTISPECIES: glutamine amidotransferase [Planktothrix]MBD2484211.1 glutamine amidotransferase [Planktothrix sp. FACHB-1365]MBE9144136.1 glutamine amidotransferase [Planktothrix mougeotii LEGE 06226]